MKSIKDINLHGKKVLLRLDLNLPLDGDKIRDDSRLQAAVPTIKYALAQGAAVMLMSHLGRPNEGEFSEDMSLKQIQNAISKHLGQPVIWLGADFKNAKLNPGQVGLFENVRFLIGENANSDALGKLMATCCDVYVFDAFATAHRAQASTAAVAKHAPIACAGLLVYKELEYLTKALKNPERPMLAIVGGAKVSGKIAVIENLITKVDAIIVGGGIANTFLAAKGYNVAKSLYEPDWVEKARELLAFAAANNVIFPLPEDVIVAEKLAADVTTLTCDVTAVPDGFAIFDIGPKATAVYADLISNMHTIVWNGPVGVFEIPAFANGTKVLTHAISNARALTIAGGGDTVAAIAEFGNFADISYISTAGGAFLDFLSGAELPAIVALG
jgi:phosphoglycerate kinase